MRTIIYRTSTNEGDTILRLQDINVFLSGISHIFSLTSVKLKIKLSISNNIGNNNGNGKLLSITTTSIKKGPIPAIEFPSFFYGATLFTPHFVYDLTMYTCLSFIHSSWSTFGFWIKGIRLLILNVLILIQCDSIHILKRHSTFTHTRPHCASQISLIK